MPTKSKPRLTPSFTPARTRTRQDGWTPAKQIAFIEALSESGCIHEACATVGMSRVSAYRLRMRVDAQGFRIAWDAALDLAIRRLSDECFSRALNGEVVPHFYKGEQVGEHRRYDNRLAMFLMRYRDPLRYAATLDQMVYAGHAEQAPLAFSRARDRAADEAHGIADDPAEDAPFPAPPYATVEISRAVAAAHEQALIESDAPIHGSDYRRRHFTEKRRAYHAALRGADPGGERSGQA